MRSRELAWEISVGAVLCAAVVLGGATQEGFVGQALVRLASIPLLLAALARLRRRELAREAIAPLILFAAILALPLLQLVPLPPGLWTLLPGRARLAEVYGLAGLRTPWLPVSLTPEATWNAELALLPPAAVFLSVLSTPAKGRAWLLHAVLALAVLSLGLGALQTASGPDGGLYLYRRTNVGMPVGLFANRNHLAALLLCALPLAACLVAVRGRREDRRRRWIAAGGLSVLLTAGIVATGSRAGLGLLAVALTGAVAAAFRTSRSGGRRAMLAAAAGLIGIVALVLIVDPGGVLAKLQQPLSAEQRVQTAPAVLKAAQIYAPVGAGLGSFDPVYRSVEHLGAVTGEFLNHAHDDYLELWLEAGVVGALAAAAVLALFGRALWQVWRKGQGGSPNRRLARAASVGVAVLLIHSLADYPLRTQALATIFALFCACMIEPAFTRSPNASAPHDSAAWD